MIRWFAGHPTASNLLLILVLAMGLFAAPMLKRETFPDFQPSEVSINIEYRGASAADVEDAICLRVVDALKSVDNMEELTCTAQDNVASAVAKMSPGGDPGRFLNDIDSEISAISDFPSNADTAIVSQMHTTDLVAALAVSGDMEFSHLESYANYLESRLFEIDNVAEVKINGLSQRRWQIEVSSDLLQQYGLSISDVSRLIRQQNIDLPLGTIETKAQDIQLRFVDQSRSIADLQDLVIISGTTGGEIKLGDIAEITQVYSNEEDKVLFNGERALVLDIMKNKESDALNVMALITEFVEEEQLAVGSGVKLTITQDMTTIVAERLQMLVSNGIIGLILVSALMSIFYRPKLAIWAILGLPMAFSGAFVVMAIFGLSINMITLVGFLVSIGIVMDDSVVITDSIATQVAHGKSALEAVTTGVKQVLPGVMSSFMTTIAVFAPLSFLSGELGTVLEVMPIVLIAALAASLIEAFWILPHHLKKPISQIKTGKTQGASKIVDAAFDKLREGSGKLADVAIRGRYFTAALLIIVLLGSVGFILGGNIKLEAMPDIEGNLLDARILLPQGSTLEQTEEAVEKVVAAVDRVNEQLSPLQPDGVDLVEATQVRFNQNLSAQESGPHLATVTIDLLTAEIRSTGLDEFISLWREEIGPIYGLVSLTIQEPGFGPAGVPIEIQIQGEDLDRMKQASTELVDYLSTYVGVFNALDDLRPGKPQRQLSLSDGASSLGITADSVASQLRSSLIGDIVDSLQIGDQTVEIIVRQTTSESATLDALENALIISKSGQAVPLDVVTTTTEVRDWAKINRIDGIRTVTVEANVDAGLANANAIVKDVQANWTPIFEEKYPELELVFAGQVSATADTGSSIARGLGIGLVGVFLILSFQFRSYIEPLIVMVAIPLSFLGAIWGHVFMGFDISMPSLIGAASLAGIVVNNSILLMQYINKFRQEGYDVIIAAGKASRARFRPIFITTMTTISGMAPLLAETSTQAAAIVPLVVSLVFGMAVSTILVLLALPALYTILDDLGLTGFKAQQRVAAPAQQLAIDKALPG